MEKNWSNPLAVFGALVAAMGGGGDTGSAFPQSDADDFAYGARFVPGEVTEARRKGEKVEFIHTCTNACCWYWKFSDGTQIYHFERTSFEAIAKANGHTWEGQFHGKAGACKQCGNTHTGGGTIKPGKK
jgi:hypothetical protein